MAYIYNDEIMLCHDCGMMHATGDFTFLDFSYSEADAARRIQEYEDGIAGLIGDDGTLHLCCGDSERDLEFSNLPCDCCGTELAGSRMHFVLLADGEESSQ